MLRQVLQELESARGLVSLDDVSRKLGVERSALDGMVDFWVRKGRLRADYLTAGTGSCAGDTCGAFCSSCPLAEGVNSCRLSMHIQKAYE